MRAEADCDHQMGHTRDDIVGQKSKTCLLLDSTPPAVQRAHHLIDLLFEIAAVQTMLICSLQRGLIVIHQVR